MELYRIYRESARCTSARMTSSVWRRRVEADGAWQQERSSRDALALVTVDTGPDPCLTLMGWELFLIREPNRSRTQDCSVLFFQMNFYLLEKNQQEASMSNVEPISIATTLACCLLSGTS